MSADIQRLFSEQRWDEITSQIDTGTDNPENSRALVVFNPTDAPVTGIAEFQVDMPWRAGKSLPAIRVSHLISRRKCASFITEPDRTGSRIQFLLHFEVENVPANGWDTYIAEYVGEGNVQQIGESPKTTSLIVVETLRHPGSSPPSWP